MNNNNNIKNNKNKIDEKEPEDENERQVHTNNRLLISKGSCEANMVPDKNMDVEREKVGGVKVRAQRHPAKW